MMSSDQPPSGGQLVGSHGEQHHAIRLPDQATAHAAHDARSRPRVHGCPEDVLEDTPESLFFEGCFDPPPKIASGDIKYQERHHGMWYPR